MAQLQALAFTDGALLARGETVEQAGRHVVDDQPIVANLRDGRIEELIRAEGFGRLGQHRRETFLVGQAGAREHAPERFEAAEMPRRALSRLIEGGLHAGDVGRQLALRPAQREHVAHAGTQLTRIGGLAREGGGAAFERRAPGAGFVPGQHDDRYADAAGDGADRVDERKRIQTRHRRVDQHQIRFVLFAPREGRARRVEARDGHPGEVAECGPRVAAFLDDDGAQLHSAATFVVGSMDSTRLLLHSEGPHDGARSSRPCESTGG